MCMPISRERDLLEDWVSPFDSLVEVGFFPLIGSLPPLFCGAHG
jgi:hypothetical protein